MAVSLPAFAQRVMVFGSTRNIVATSAAAQQAPCGPRRPLMAPHFAPRFLFLVWVAGEEGEAAELLCSDVLHQDAPDVQIRHREDDVGSARHSP
jgi:hypothetical protein